MFIVHKLIIHKYQVIETQKCGFGTPFELL